MRGSSPSALIIRLDGIGDALALTPLLAALRERALPVDAVLREENAAIFAPGTLRHIIRADFSMRANDRQSLAQIERLGGELAANRYSHVLVATEDPSGYRLARATRAPVRVGFVNGWGKPLKTFWARSFLTQAIFRTAGLDRRSPHECEVLFALGRGLVAEDRPTRELGRLRPLVIESDPPPRNDVAVQITQKWERFGSGRIAELVKRLSLRHAVRLIAADAEADYAGAIAASCGAELELFTDLAPWKRAIAAARALVAPDSGAVHVAGTIGTPVVALFPPSRDFELQKARWSPWASPARILRADAGWAGATERALDDLLGR